ncbi:MAG: XRE family transcriptional regulator [Bacilli bacterium]|nr:XRE family transcriptional regulator [Bacilli bacterium]MBR2711478.1 XRE family transcriptional regulator [Bacilli bacterium]
MFKNLEAELKRIDKAQKDLAELLDIHLSTLNSKMNGHTEFSLGECKKIKDKWFQNLTLEYLFEETKKEK